MQVPAYRDRELLPTLRDLLDMAARPERVILAAAWQHGPDEAGLAGERLSTHLLDLLAAGSQGCNWARALPQQRLDGEEYTLFLDSHHRFVPGWNETLLDLHRRLREDGIERPLLSGYLPPFDPADDPAGRVRAVYRMDLVQRRDGLMHRLTGHAVPGWERLMRPLPAAYVRSCCSRTAASTSWSDGPGDLLLRRRGGRGAARLHPRLRPSHPRSCWARTSTTAVPARRTGRTTPTL